MSVFRLLSTPERRRINLSSTRAVSTFDAFFNLSVEADKPAQLTILETLKSYKNKSLEMHSMSNLKASMVRSTSVRFWGVGKGFLTGLKEIMLGNYFSTSMVSPETFKNSSEYDFYPTEISNCLKPVDPNGKKMKLDSVLSSIPSNLISGMASSRSLQFSKAKGENDVPKSVGVKSLIDCIDRLLPSSQNVFCDKNDQVCSQGLLKKSDDKCKQTSPRDQGMDRDCNKATRPNAMPVSQVSRFMRGVKISEQVSVESPPLKNSAEYGFCPTEISDYPKPEDLNRKKMKLDSGLSSICSNQTHRIPSNRSLRFSKEKGENGLPESADVKDLMGCVDGLLPTSLNIFSDTKYQVCSEGLLEKSDDQGKQTSSRDQGMDMYCNKITRPSAMSMPQVSPSMKDVKVSQQVSVESPRTLKNSAEYGFSATEFSNCPKPVYLNQKKMKFDSGLSSISSNLTHGMASNRSLGFSKSKGENELPDSADVKDLMGCIDGLLPSSKNIFSDTNDQFCIQGLLEKYDDKSKHTSSRDQGMDRDCNKVTRPNAMPMSQASPNMRGVNVSQQIQFKKNNDEPDARYTDTDQGMDRDCNRVARPNAMSMSQVLPSMRGVKVSPQIPFKKNNDQPGVPDSNSDEFKVLVRFLPKSANYGDIMNGLKTCGPVVDVREIPSVEGSKFKDAYVCFETLDGMRKALEKIDVTVKHSDLIVEVVVEGSFPYESLAHKLPIPCLIGNPDAPFSLVKNPTRTVTVNGISPDISLGNLGDAFASRGSGISTCFFGQSSSVAYVEFETEDAKENAIAGHTICVLGRPLVVHRLDAPRTTVVRISNLKLHPMKAESICKPLGQVKHAISKSSDIVDVHFMVTEWPNMLHILNTLNGMVVDGGKMVAVPAPCFPPKIIHALWSHPEERRRLKGVIRGLAHQLNQKSVSGGALKRLIARCYRDDEV